MFLSRTVLGEKHFIGLDFDAYTEWTSNLIGTFGTTSKKFWSGRCEFRSASSGDLVLRVRNSWSLQSRCKIETATGTKLYKLCSRRHATSKVKDYRDHIVLTAKLNVSRRYVRVWKGSNRETSPWLKVKFSLREGRIAIVEMRSGRKLATLNKK